MSRQMLVPLRLLALSTDPVFGQVGEIYINTVTKNLRVHNGTTWIELTPPSTDPTPFYMHTHAYDGSVHTVVSETGDEYKAHSVIISTGASAKWLGLESETRLMNQGVSACAVCDGFFYRNQTVAVVGAGDTAAEEASYLANLCTKVHLIVRRGEMRASLIMQERVKNNPKIEIHWNSETEEILGDANGVTGIRIVNNVTKEKEEIALTGFFVAIGHQESEVPQMK